MKKSLLRLFTLFMLLGLSTQAFAQVPTISSTLNNKADVVRGVETAFTVTVTQNNVPANTMVRAKMTVSAVQAANITLMYKEGETYLPLTMGADGTAFYGDAAGFALADATEEFKIAFSTSGTYEYRLEIVQVSNNAVLATANERVEVLNTTGTGTKVARNVVAVYPTISNGNVTVDLADMRQAQVQVLDVLGRTVTTLENKTGTAQLNTAQFAKGTYFVKVRKDDKSATGKFLVR